MVRKFTIYVAFVPKLFSNGIIKVKCLVRYSLLSRTDLEIETKFTPNRETLVGVMVFTISNEEFDATTALLSRPLGWVVHNSGFQPF